MTIEELIQASISMDDEEKGMWLEILPTMEKVHVQRLKDILENEQEKLWKLAL